MAKMGTRFVVFSIILQTLAVSTCYGNLFTEPEVFITISSVVDPPVEDVIQDTMIELNWARFPAPAEGDWVGLFNYDPNSGSDVPALVTVALNSSTGSGYFKTPVRFGRPPLDGTSIGDNCLGFWIAYMTSGDSNPVLVNCFRKYPTWMNDLKEIIGDIPLHSLMIPGTHDAGAIQEYDPVESNPVPVRYSVCQEEQLYRQFVHGVRYLDMRVAHYPDTDEKFWINHGSARYAPLKTLFDAVNQFVTETNELIFMDFHGFPVGMGNVEQHEELIQYVQEHVGPLLIHKSEANMNLTLNHVWGLKKNVILTYQRDEIREKYDFLWPYLIHAWGDVNQVKALENYFGQVALNEYGCKGIFWSAQAEMTPKQTDYIFYPLVGLRGFAQMVNIPLTFWWQRPEWYSRTMIVSTDFFLGSNIMEMAVKVNRNRAVCRPPDTGSENSGSRLATLGLLITGVGSFLNFLVAKGIL